MSDTRRTFRDPNGLRVLRDATRLLHFDEDGVPVCGYDGEVIAAIHPPSRNRQNLPAVGSPTVGRR